MSSTDEYKFGFKEIWQGIFKLPVFLKFTESFNRSKFTLILQLIALMLSVFTVSCIVGSFFAEGISFDKIIGSFSIGGAILLFGYFLLGLFLNAVQTIGLSIFFEIKKEVALCVIFVMICLLFGAYWVNIHSLKDPKSPQLP